MIEYHEFIEERMMSCDTEFTEMSKVFRYYVCINEAKYFSDDVVIEKIEGTDQFKITMTDVWVDLINCSRRIVKRIESVSNEYEFIEL
jgi:hypothetical protein